MFFNFKFMKKKLFLLCLLLQALYSNAFVVDCISYYIIPSTTNVSVTGTQCNLTFIDIPEIVTYQGITYNVVEIAQYSFTSNSVLQEIILPDSILSIGTGAFQYCTALQSISLPTSLTSISEALFSYCTQLNNVVLPDILTTINDYAFEGCSSLTEIDMPNSVTSIGNGSFYGCTAMTMVYFSNSIISLGSYAFQGCTNLVDIEIPDSVLSIGQGVFSSCTGLTSVVLSNSITTIPNEAFLNCNNLPSITIPNSITSIQNDAFNSCSALTSIIIPEGVTSIGSFAFYNCSSLTTVTLPSSITFIGNYAFAVCTSLTSFYNDMPNPLSIDASVFAFVNQPACTLYVPIGSEALYEAAVVWQDFAPITTLINGHFTLKDFKIYPNPVNDYLYFEKSNDVTINNIIIFDCNGRILKSYNENMISNTLDLSFLKNGAYIIKLTTFKDVFFIKILKN